MSSLSIVWNYVPPKISAPKYFGSGQPQRVNFWCHSHPGPSDMQNQTKRTRVFRHPERPLAFDIFFPPRIFFRKVRSRDLLKDPGGGGKGPTGWLQKRCWLDLGGGGGVGGRGGVQLAGSGLGCPPQKKTEKPKSSQVSILQAEFGGEIPKVWAPKCHSWSGLTPLKFVFK